MDEELKKLIEQARSAGASDDEIYRAVSVRQAQQQTQKPKENFFVKNLPTIGAIGAGLVAAPFTGGMSLLPALGIAAGAGAAGAAAGSFTRQGLTKSKIDPTEIAKEAGSGAVGGAVGQAGGMAFKAASKVLSKGATNVGENLAIRALRPSKTQLTNFATQHGEDMASVLQRYGAQGMKSGQLVDDIIAPIQSSFDDIVKNTKIPVSRNVLDKNFYNKVKVLLDSGDLDDVKVAEKILTQYDSIIGNNKALSLADVNKFRGNFDSKVKSFLVSDPLKAGEKRVIADAFRDSVREVADTTGVNVGGKSLAETGRELSKLYDIDKIAKVQSNLGRGNLPVGLTTLLGATAGGVPGGAGGAIAGMAGTALLNNPKTIRILSQLATSAGEKLSTQGISTGIKGAVSNAIPLTIGQVGARMGGQQQALPTDINKVNMPSQDTTQTQDQEQLQQIFSAAMMEDLQTTGGKNIPELKTIMETMASTGSGKAKTEAQVARDDTVALIDSTLSDISQNPNIKTGIVNAPIQGVAAKLGMADEDTLAFNSKLSMLKASIAKARAGTSFTPNEEKLLNQYTPTVGDSKQQIVSKLSNLYQFFSQRKETNITGNTLPSSVSGVQF